VAVAAEDALASIVGTSQETRRLKEMIRKIAPTDATILILGENGTGKDLVAQAVHASSARSIGPFVPVNCAAIPDTLLESELFGHEKGAFTGAQARRRGKFELSDGGTLFLDEVGDMSITAQAKILRALQERSFNSIGGESHLDVDCRVIAATSKDLVAEVDKEHFREDLYYRLNEITIPIPPLRERREDIPVLVEHFIEVFAQETETQVRGVSDVALKYLMQHSWPGNVRELKNVIKRAILLADGDTIWLEHLPFDARIRTEDAMRSEGLPLRLSDVERQHILRVLQMTNGNKSETARILGVSRPRLDRKLRSYGMHPFRGKALQD